VRPARVEVEDDAALAGRVGRLTADKVRLLGSVGDDVAGAAHDAGLWVDDVAVVGQPDLEILRWVREQALSETRHRHGDPSARLAAPD
jgi:RHH-type proline utilization regulon transcriptional repressor/proline dehydrogenase/delta 1-pyrroline-5-carboxylate dehydrogenase